MSTVQESCSHHAHFMYKKTFYKPWIISVLSISAEMICNARLLSAAGDLDAVAIFTVGDLGAMVIFTVRDLDPIVIFTVFPPFVTYCFLAPATASSFRPHSEGDYHCSHWICGDTCKVLPGSNPSMCWTWSFQVVDFPGLPSHSLFSLVENLTVSSELALRHSFVAHPTQTLLNT